MSSADEALPFKGRTILAVFAHPDDESLACGGTLARLADAGARIILACATHGRAGSVSDPSLISGSDLGRVRAGELREAGKILGVAEVVIFDYPDKELRWEGIKALEVDLMAVIKRHRPDAVITFDEDGLYWHLDHVAIHERTNGVVGFLGDEAPALYFVSMEKGSMRTILDCVVASGKIPQGANFWGIPPDSFGAAAEPPDFVLDVQDWVPRKLAALRCHRSQLSPLNPLLFVDDADARSALGFEKFRRAQPLHGEALLEPLADPVASARFLRQE